MFCHVSVFKTSTFEFHYSDSVSCDGGTLKCPDSYCIPLVYQCDGKWDCPNGEDEVECGELSSYDVMCISIYFVTCYVISCLRFTEIVVNSTS